MGEIACLKLCSRKLLKGKNGINILVVNLYYGIFRVAIVYKNEIRIQTPKQFVSLSFGEKDLRFGF